MRYTCTTVCQQDFENEIGAKLVLVNLDYVQVQIPLDWGSKQSLESGYIEWKNACHLPNKLNSKYEILYLTTPFKEKKINICNTNGLHYIYIYI